jgi:type VI protein secretion system component VasK
LPHELEVEVVSEIAQLRAAIDREAAATDVMLSEHPSTSADLADHRELRRQLAALHTEVARALCQSQAQPALRAELATLLSFARTLRTDAEAWRAALQAGLKALARERQASAAEREALLRRRDDLQSSIDAAAARIARDNGGECRGTMPCFPLGEAVNVCSVTVLSPRRRLRLQRPWLVTLNDARDEVLVRRCDG